MTLHGHNLLELYNFSNGFDKKTVINIFENLFIEYIKSMLKYINSKNILHGI